MKRILLIDDEKNFLESLKEGLDPEAELFETEIVFSVDQAIEKISTNPYDLIITDIRMPEKSGLDLLVYLKKNHFKGEIMVMTAYGDADFTDQIKALGGIKIISKPFEFDWFKNMLVEHFSDKGFSGTIDSIDLTSILQIIHMEKKSACIEIIIDKDKGYLFFEDGELINAEFKDIKGEEAALKMIGNNRGHFNIVKTKKRTKQSIRIPFMNLLMGIMKEVDELIEDKKSRSANRKTQIVADDALTSELKKIGGYINLSLFDINGQTLFTDRENSKSLQSLIHLFVEAAEAGADILEREFESELELNYFQTSHEFFVFSWIIKLKIGLILHMEKEGNISKVKFELNKIKNNADRLINIKEEYGD